MDEYVKNIREKIGHMPMYMPTTGLLICKNRKVLLQKRADNNLWAMHGGGMQPNEEFLTALNREINEELNIKPINPKLFGIYSGEKLYHEYPNGDKVYIINHVFICEDYEGTINFNDGEVTEFKWFDIDNLPENLMGVDIPALRDISLYLESNNTIVR